MRERGLRFLPIVWATLAALCVLGVAVAVDPLVRHGYTVSWYATSPSGERIETARTTEHRIVFPNDHRPMARIVEGWNFQRLGVPVDVPPIDATFRARIRFPAAGRYMHVTATGDSLVHIDGHAIDADDRVSGGFHLVEVDWHAPIEPSDYFRLEWGPSPTASEPVPREAIWLADGDFPATRIGLWIASLLFALGAFFVVHRVLTTEDDVRRRTIHVALVVALVCTGVGYRLLDYGVMPDWRDNDDERFACWNGYFLLTEGHPRALTIWPAEYVGVADITVHPYFGRVFHLITPYFEHPPLMHLLVGTAGILGGAHEFREIRLSHARLVPIALCGISIALMIAIGRRLEKKRSMAPYLGALLYAVLPWIVIQTRVIKEESLLTPLSLGCMYFFLRWRDDKRARDLVVAAVLAGLCPLAKVPGAAFILTLAVLVMREAGPAALARVLAITVPIAALWPVYGAVFGWRAYSLTQTIQASRMVHFNIFLRFFDDAIINTILIGRGWLLFLWFGTLGGMLRRSRDFVITMGTPLIAYLTAIALGSGDWTYGWYLTPMLPWLCLGAGLFIADTWKSPDLVRGAFLTFVLLFYTLNFAFSPEWMRNWGFHNEIRWIVTTVLLLGWSPFALATAFPGPGTRNLARFAIVMILVVVVVQSWLFVFRWEEFQQIFGSFDRNRGFDT